MNLIAVFVVVAVFFAFTGEAAVTTTKPKATTTTKKPTINSFKICRDVSSTATSGSIQPLDGLTPVATGTPRACNFSIVVPSDQRVQFYCSVANLSLFNYSLASFGGKQVLETYSLRNTVDLFMAISPIETNRLYTSRDNTLLITYRVVNAADRFNCTWATIKAPTTAKTDFRWCGDEQTSVANGTIQTLPGTEDDESAWRMCPFFINSSPNRQLQMYCSGFNISGSLGLMTFQGVASIMEWTWLPKMNMATANGNRTDLLNFYFRDDKFNCKWTTIATPTTTAMTTSDFSFCLRAQSTATNGTIQQLASLTLGVGESKWCLYSIIAPADKRIQLSCSVVSFTQNPDVFNYLMFDGATDSPFNADGSMLPIVNRIYTSVNNRLDLTAIYVKGDKFNCNWKTIPAVSSSLTTFNFCEHGESTIPSGTIQFSTSMQSGDSRMCRFTVTAPQIKRIRFNCPQTTSDITLLEFDEFGTSFTLVSPVVANKNYTSYSNQVLLYTNVTQTQRFNCKWNFA